MKSRTVLGCEEIINQAVEEGFTNQIDWRSLARIIREVKGGDPRTLKNWRTNLFELGYIEQPAPLIFKLNLAKCEGAIEKAVKSVGQKKLM